MTKQERGGHIIFSRSHGFAKQPFKGEQASREMLDRQESQKDVQQGLTQKLSGAAVEGEHVFPLLLRPPCAAA